MPILSPCTDIKSLIEQHAGIQVVGKPSRVRGVLEYHSNCPWCGGEDRFITRPETGQYTCAVRAKGCGKQGDMIDFLKDYCGMTRWEACEEIGIDPYELEFLRADLDQSTLARKSTAPGKVWRDRAEEEVALAQARLRRPAGSLGLNTLRARGFSDEIIQVRGLGYIPLTNGRYRREDPLESWGLTYEEAQKEHVNVFEGISIPWYVGKQIWKLEVRRITEADPDHRTLEILGSHESLYNCDAIEPGKPVVLVEGALDAISGIQVCGNDLAVFVATGGTGKARFDLWIKRLLEASCVLVAFDDDESGHIGADLWTDILPNALRWVPWKHDLNDMLRDGDDIRDWLTEGLEWYELIARAKKIPVKPDPIVSIPPVASLAVATCSQCRRPADRLVDVLGGPGQATFTKHDPALTLEQYARQVRPPYTPISLPALPRKRCPHSVFFLNTGKQSPCKGDPLVHGWCALHARSYELLCLGAVLGYPAADLTPRGIAAGAAQWEAYAECASEKWLIVDIKRIRARFNYHEPLPIALPLVQMREGPSETEKYSRDTFLGSEPIALSQEAFL